MLSWHKYPIATLLSIQIASYYSIKRLVLEYLVSLIIDHLLNSNGIILFPIYSNLTDKLVVIYKF